MTFSTFITPQYLYKWTIIDDNIDPNLLDTFIIKAQDVNIQSVIGNTLYVRLMNDVYLETKGLTGIGIPGSLTASYATVVNDYIQKCQAEWTVYHCLPYINYRLTNKAVSEKKSEWSDATELKNIQYLREDIRNTAEFLSTRIREYILNNQLQFPEFFQIIPNQLQITPKPSQYFSGVWLPNFPKLTREDRYRGQIGNRNYNGGYYGYQNNEGY